MRRWINIFAAVWFRLFSRDLTFRHALALSAVFHLGILVVCSAVVALMHFHSDVDLPKRLEFSFMPEDESTAATVGMQPQGSATSRPANIPEHVPLSPEEEIIPEAPVSGHLNFEGSMNEALPEDRPFEAPLASADPGANLTEASPNPNYLDVGPEPSPLRSTFDFRERLTHSLQRIPLLDEGLRFVPASIAIPYKQRRNIRKKIEKLVKKLPLEVYQDTVITWEENGQNYTVELQHVPAPDEMQLDEIVVTVSQVEGGRRLSTQIRFQRLAFSQFAQFVDYWDPQVSIHDDEFDGRFHTNSEFTISGRGGIHPRFRGKVTTTGYSIAPSSRFFFLNTDSVFLDGIEVGVDIIHFPKNLKAWFQNLTEVDSLAKIFDQEIWITFHPNGSFSWRTAESSRSENVRLPVEHAYCILGRENAKLHVKGVVRGRVLVYSMKKIIIDGSITYARHPAIVHDSPDYLGLVSEGAIEIAPHKVTGPGDLYIHAAILAKGYFRVRNFFSGGPATLHIYGSLSAGSLTATEPRYATRIRFDRRLQKRRPPYFPMTDRWEIIDWDERWWMSSEE